MCTLSLKAGKRERNPLSASPGWSWSFRGKVSEPIRFGDVQSIEGGTLAKKSPHNIPSFLLVFL